MTQPTRPFLPLPPPRPMTDLRAIEIAIEVLEQVTGFARLIGQINGLGEAQLDRSADELTSAILRLGTIRADLVREGRHCIEG